MTHSGRISTSETGPQICRIHAERTAAFLGVHLESGHPAFGQDRTSGVRPKANFRSAFSQWLFIAMSLSPLCPSQERRMR
jgi:hypothetical protein